MTERQIFQRFLERALAFAHAALDEPSFERVTEAQKYAADVAPRLKQLHRFEFTLAEARQIVVLMTQLRTVLAAVDKQAEPAARASL